MTEKLNFMVFRALFLFKIHILKIWQLTSGNSAVLLEERKLNMSR